MLTLFRLLALLPLWLLHAVGAALGLVALPLRKRSADLHANLSQAGLHHSGMALRAAMHMGRGMAELPAVWLRPLPRTLALVREVNGWQHVEAARNAGRGILALTPHLGCWELGGIYIGSRLPITFLYRPPRQAWVDALMRRGRERGGVRLATPDTKGVRAMLTALKRGEAVGILPDQVASRGDGVWAPVFGRPAYSPTLSFRLAASTGAVPLLFWCERLSWGRGFRLWVEPLPALPEAAEQAAVVLNQAIEGIIRRHPEQYLWSYRRYKNPLPPTATGDPA